MDRTPPRHVLEKLRKEVNFGCPVLECGIPYLTWHHFDPPWRVRQHHEPAGMIALCATHALLADGGHWTKEQLLQMKQTPFVKPDQISHLYDYLRRNIVCIIGNVAYRVQNILEVNGERVIGFEKDAEGYDRLNLLIRDKQGSPMLVMENNFWTAYSEKLYDLHASAQGKELRIVSMDGVTDLTMRFDDHPLSEFRQRLVKGCEEVSFPESMGEPMKECLIKSITTSIDQFICDIGMPETVPTWSIKGNLSWGERRLVIREFEIEDERNNVFAMTFVVGAKAAFSLKASSTAVGVT